MDDNHKLSKQAKPQEFELVELLFQEYISSNIASPNIEYSFQARFQSFINHIPSYLHSSSKIGFFTHFFFGSFATLLDTKLSKKLDIKKLQYSFNTIDNLRIVAETDDKTHIFIFTENSSKNNKKQKQDKNKELAFTKQEWQQLKSRAYTDADNDNLEISVITINKSKGSIKVTVEKQDIKDDGDSTKKYHDITKQCVHQNGQDIFLEKKILKLSIGEKEKSKNALKFILNYTKKIHDHYQNIPYGDSAQEANQHGFVAGIFNNFRYRENAHVYLEQFAGRGYADIVLLVRGADRATKSIPIIIELKAGTSIGTTSKEALKQVLDYTQGFQPNNMRILSLADNILCVGMNLDHNVSSFIQMQLVQRQSKVIPVIQSIITHIIENDFANRNLMEDDLIAIQNQITGLLENTYQTFPGTGEKSSAHYYSRFIIGESFLLQDYDKHIFVYDKDEHIATNIVIDHHETRLKDGSTTKKKKIEKIVDDSNAVTSLLLLSKDQDESAIILNIIDANREIEPKNIPLDNALIGNRKIILLDIKFNIDQSSKEFQKYCKVQVGKVYNSALEYNKANNIQAKGNLKKIGFKTSIELSAQIKNAIDSQQNLMISESKYKELFAKIGEVIYPVKSLINSESEFQGILEGIFKYYSDLKLGQKLNRRELVLTEFQTGGGSRIDMIIQAIGELHQGAKEYIPVGLELKYDASVKLNSFDKRQDKYIQGSILAHKEQVLVKKLLADQTERYAQGAAIKTITDGNKVAIMGIVFNKQAQDHNNLLMTTEKFVEANIVHSSKLYTTSVNIDVASINDLPKLDSEEFIPDWVERDTLDLIGKIEADDDSMWYLSNSLLDDQKMQELQVLLQKDKQLARYIDGLDLSFNSVTANGVKELIKQLRRLVYLDLSDNDLANNNLLDLTEIIEDIQVPILKISDIGMNDEQMGKIFKSFAENDKISDLEIMHLEDDNNPVMSQDTANKIAEYLRSTRTLNHLNLAKNKISDAAISIIAQGLKEQKTLNSLVLTENSIGIKGAQKLGSVLKDTAISHVDLSGNPLGLFGVEQIVKNLNEAKNIHSIELVNVGLNYNSNTSNKLLLSIIRSLFENQHLTKINIAENNIGNGALFNIFKILSTMEEKSNLEFLSLAGNKIDWGAHEITINTLKSYMTNCIKQNQKIRSLDLAFMAIDDDIGQEIARALEQNVSLINLDLEGNDLIGSKTVTSLAKVLSTHQYLKYLNLSKNKLSIADLKAILKAIKMNQVVSHIDLSGSDFSSMITNDPIGKQYLDLDNHYINFESLLQGNTELKYLNLAACTLNTKSLLSLFRAIENNVSLEVLDIRNNKIESSIVDKIIGSLNKNANQGLDIGLKVLHVSKEDLSNSAISKLTAESLGILVLVEGDESASVSLSLEERVMQPYVINPVDRKGVLELDRGHQTFESATIKGHYHYWLQAHDMADIARVYYGYNNREIEIIGSIGQLSTQITRYRANNNNARPLTMILNIGEDGAGGNHWVSLVLNRVGSNNYGYYIDSIGEHINSNIASILSQHRILIHDLSNRQQADGYNCGLWALENSRITCEIVEANRNENNEHIRNSLVRSRSEEEFQEIRDNILRELLYDNQRQVNLKYQGKMSVELQAVLNNYRTNINLQILDEDLPNPITATCLLGTSRGKRSINKCKIGWLDVDEISSIKTRKIEDIIIDREKFLKHSRQYIDDEQKSLQLVRLINELQKQGSKAIGKYTGLFDKVIDTGGYQNYIQQERINYLGSHIINKDSNSINLKLKLKLINAVGKAQLIHGIYSTIVSCQDQSMSQCALSVSALGYSFLSQPIENMMVKVAPKIVKNAADVTGKIVPRVLSHNTKFMVEIFGVKYSTKIAKGGAGAIVGVFDIIDIGMSTNALIKCNKKADSDHPCSDKEIRDNIASITFSSVAFISGVALTAASATGPIGVAVGAVTVIGQGIYSGISNIIEYEEKYDTTIEENWSIFWRTALLRDMAKDVVHLKARHDHINAQVKKAWNILETLPEEIVGYAIGLGKIESAYKPPCNRIRVENPIFGSRPKTGPYKDTDTYISYALKCDHRTQLFPTLYPSHTNINMQDRDIKYTKNLSRILPDPIVNATMICLPQITDMIYEKNITSSRSDAIYKCDNAVVMVYNQRQHSQVKDKYIIFDLKNVNSGTIIGNNILNNIFQIFEGDPVICGGAALDNRFIILSDKYHGKIYLDINSTNIIDVSLLHNQHIISMEYTHIYPLTMNISITANKGTISQIYSKTKDIEIRYIGRKYKVDKIICKQLLYQRDRNIVDDDNKNEHNNIIIDSGGGLNADQQDEILNCTHVIISPNTVMQGGYNNYTIYIKSLDYAKNYSASAISKIDIAGKGTILFPEISLLKNCEIMKQGNNILISIIMPLGNNTQYTLVLSNNKDHNPNYKLIDKDKNLIDILDYNKLQLYTECNFNTLGEVVNYYENVSSNKEDYVVFGTVKNTQYNNFGYFGSSERDIIIINKDVAYVKGNNGSDLYIIDDNSVYSVIDNKAKDLQLDILQLPVNNINNISLIKDDNNLHLLFYNKDEVKGYRDMQQIVIINNYFQDNLYRHIALMDKHNNSYIPFKQNEVIELLPFYHASFDRNIFILSSNNKETVIDIDSIVFYKQGNNLLLTEKPSNSFNSLNIILRDYNKDQQAWLDTKLYTYNNGDIGSIVDLNNAELSTIRYQDQYNSLIKEYVVDLTAKNHQINYNQRKFNNAPLAKEDNEESRGIVIFQNISVDSLKAKRHNNDLILKNSISNKKLTIKNWYNNHTEYKISMFEFNTGVEPERIYISHDFIRKIEFNHRLSNEIFNLDNKTVSAVISYLISGCDKQYIFEKRLTYSFLENERCRLSSNNLSVEEIIQDINSSNDTSGKALLLLAAKAHNKLLLQYDLIEKDILNNSCFNTILSTSKIQEMIEYINTHTNNNLIRFKQFMDNNKNEIQNIITKLATSHVFLDNHHKYRHHHGEDNRGGYHSDNKHVPGQYRQRRDVESEKKIVSYNDDAMLELQDNVKVMSSSSTGSSTKPIGYSVVNWIRDTLSKLKYLFNHVKKEIVFNIDDNVTKQEILDIDVSDNQFDQYNYVGELSHIIAFDGLSRSAYEAGHAAHNDKISCYTAFDTNATLMLTNLIVHKLTRVKYNYDNKSIITNNLNAEYAQNLVYSSYAPNTEENIELLGTMASSS